MEEKKKQLLSELQPLLEEEKQKLRKTTVMEGAWKTMLVGRTNTVIGKITTFLGGGKTKTEKTTILVGRTKTVAGRVAIV